jgi:hypothetical protein
MDQLRTSLDSSFDAVDVPVIEDQIFIFQYLRRPEYESGQDFGGEREQAAQFLPRLVFCNPGRVRCMLMPVSEARTRTGDAYSMHC